MGDIMWRIYGTTPSSSASQSDSYISGTSKSSPTDKEFQYYFDDVGVVPMFHSVAVSLGQGGYRLEWNYSTTPCIRRVKRRWSRRPERLLRPGRSIFLSWMMDLGAILISRLMSVRVIVVRGLLRVRRVVRVRQVVMMRGALVRLNFKAAIRWRVSGSILARGRMRQRRVCLPFEGRSGVVYVKAIRK
ncbi:hypothetical protein BDW59DRAFT_150417 [Aspergillus cavernicola]|uniref:Uncharacterized protein n=1 Tax=Aspergillus cavernicola TaxID=176166 RepID=A0ABR4I036_9EURO